VEQNPYAAPRSRVDSDEAPYDATELASRGRRFLNFLIDYVGFILFSMFVGALVGFVYPPAIYALQDAGTLVNYVVGIPLWILYYLSQEALFGRTLGKLATGTRVVSAMGGTPNFGQLLGRTAARYIPFEPFSFFGRDAVGWHDSLSNTRVIRTRR
jgi:uncharacterized RDD family membrane protein YckC